MSKLMNLAEVVTKCRCIEDLIGIQAHYGLYDLETNQAITLDNMNYYADFYHAYMNRAYYKYSYPDAVDKNLIQYLLKHKGNVWFAMHMKGARKGYLLRFDYNQLLDKYGEYLKEEKETKEVYEQLTLPLEEMKNVG